MGKQRMKKYMGYKVAALLLLVAWAGLFLSNRAVLVWSSSPAEDQPFGQLTCRYFTGTGIAVRQHVYVRGGVIGRSECPRLINLG